ncbi:MAG: DUF3108 domain-containing protein [Planctomycetota bacterium]
MRIAWLSTLFWALCLAGTWGPALAADPDEPENDAESVQTGDDRGKDSAVAPSAITLQEHFQHVAMPPENLLSVARIGERLTYAVKWKGMAAGEAVLSVNRKTTVDGRPAYYLSLETESNDFLGTFYKVQDKVRSYVDAETGHSLLFIRDIQEGGYRANDFLQFDYDKNLQYYRTIKTASDTARASEKTPRPIPGPLQDPLSVLYYLRHTPLSVGMAREILVGSRKRTGILRVEVLREERVDLPDLGGFDALVVKLANGGAAQGTYDPAVFNAKGEIQVWAEKETNIPLLIRVGLPIGSAEVVLYRAENSPLNERGPQGTVK